MRNHFLLLAVLTASMAGSLPAFAQGRGPLSSDDRLFLKQAAESDIAALEAARMALVKAQDPELRDFARMEAADHRQVSQRMHRLADRKDVQLPSETSVLEGARLKLLEAADDAGFDERYADDFGDKAHQASVALYQQELELGKDRDIVAFARDVLPTLKKHLQHLASLQASEGEDEGARRTSMGASAERMNSGAARHARREIDEAVQVVQHMKADPHVTALLQSAKGVFILPDYGRGALGVGAQAGQGVLVTRQGEGFSNPVFYNLAGVGVGLQAGGAVGQLAFVLMTDKAVQDFRSGKTFSLDADAGLTVGTYSARGQASGGKVQDVVVWSGTEGAYAGASVGVTGVMVDGEANRAYYARGDATPARILDGQVQPPGNNLLGMVLAV